MYIYRSLTQKLTKIANFLDHFQKHHRLALNKNEYLQNTSTYTLRYLNIEAKQSFELI